MCSFSSSALAVPGGQTTMQFDMEQLSKDLESHPNLEDFGGNSAALQGEEERAMASLINLEKMYNGSSFLEAHPYTAVTEVNGAQLQLETFTEADEHAFQALAGNGTTEGAIAAETADAAEGAGLFTSAAGGVLISLIPISAYLAYQDITTGTNFITQAITSSTEDNKTIEERGGVGAEKMRWARYSTLAAGHNVGEDLRALYTEYCEPIEHYSGCSEKVLETRKEILSAVPVTLPGGTSSPASPPMATGKPEYFLEPESSGYWYVGGAFGCSANSTTPSGLVTKWIWEPCEHPGVEQVAGYPSILQHVATETIVNSPGFECSEAPFVLGCSSGRQIFDTLGVRAPSRMHMKLPKHATKAEVEALEGEGHHVEHYTGTVPTKETEPEVTKKLAAKLKEHGQRREEQFECHYMECELEGTEPEPETGTHPPIPGKAPEVPPPVPGTEIVPSCTLVEVSGAGCVETLKEHGFTKTKIEELTWQKAVIAKPPLTTIRTNPAEGAEVETSTEVNVIENPSSEHFPDVVPDIHHGTETGTQYKERLESEGWTKVQVNTLTETATDPTVGPDQASYTNPAEGSATAPGKATDINVEQNPSDAPVPAEGSEGIGGPTLPGFHTPSLGVLCKGFPFGVPCWLIGTIKAWSASAEAPVWGIEEFSIKGHKIPGYMFHLSQLEPIMEKVRPAMLIFITVGLVLLFYRFARGGSPGSGGGTPDVGGGGFGGSQPDEDVYL